MLAQKGCYVCGRSGSEVDMAGIERHFGLDDGDEESDGGDESKVEVESKSVE